MPPFTWECVTTDEQIMTAWQWRNDEETRHCSFHQQPQTLEYFTDRFRHHYDAFPDLPPLFALLGGERVAFLTFEPVNHPQDLRRPCCSLSINVAPGRRRQGIGTHILRQIQPWVRQRGYDTLTAEVRAENSTSAKAFENAGFLLLERCWRRIDDGEEMLPILRYGVELVLKLPFPDGLFIIAEAGSNWRMGSPDHDLALAKTLIEEAATASADAIKFQTFRASTVYVANAGSSLYLADAGIEKEISAIFEDLAMPYDMVAELASYCRQCGIAFMSTPFSVEDFAAVDPYVAVHKIASYEIGHPHLLAAAAHSGKPLILSTGASTEAEISWAVDYFYRQGGSQLVLLQCTAAYPAPLEQLNLSTIKWLKERYKVSVGLSDHSRHPTYAPVTAVALGATIIEKHFTLSNLLPGPDHFFALTPPELAEMVKAVRSAYMALGASVKKIDIVEEELSLFAKRGVQALRDIAAGETLIEGVNVAILRSGRQPLGMAPRHLLNLSGKIFVKPVAAGHGVHLTDLA